MSEAEFTKGEWVVNYDDKQSHYSDGTIEVDGFDIAIITGYNYGCVFGGVNRDFSDGYEDQDHQEHIANAHLIAAAPEMYELLTDLRHTISLAGIIGADNTAVLKSIDNLLAKARGEA